MGFMLWAKALDVMGRSSMHLAKLYDLRTSAQVSKFISSTCKYSIPHSVTVQCRGGRYIHPSLVIKNECKRNYYLSGHVKTTCLKRQSECLACSCYANGTVFTSILVNDTQKSVSTGFQCADQTGQCKCKPNYYGKSCDKRDCMWTSWSKWSSCSKACDYGGVTKRVRSHKVVQVGKGRPCIGSNEKSKPCFLGCCSGQFHCSNTKKCIPQSYRCNYRRYQCGDNQDELSCRESCTSRHTPFNSDGGGSMFYLDRHHLNCGGSGNVMQSFRFNRNQNHQFRYTYTCCRLTKTVCSNSTRRNGYTFAGNGDTRYLDRQTVSCGSNGLLSSFRLERRNGDVRYSYNCCFFSGFKSSCYNRYTAFSDEGSGRNYYLDRHHIQCPNRYFLTYFRLTRSPPNYGYHYRCCQIRG
ncbi:uncharacterized protein LOC124444682 [Xenia sp. Carnegie-2017]|nr:uncharacterized protein LOC124444682 [Xenia sp. Carnegie-2017]